MATVGSFCLIKNEILWIKAHLLSWLPYLDEMVFYDSSSDGTTELIKDMRSSHPFGHRIKLFEGKDCTDLQEDYTRLSNEALHSLSTDYAAFLHPDFILDSPGNIGFLGDAHSYTVNVRSFAGEPDGQLFEVLGGRSDWWKNIYRLNNPDLGLHYYGAYGSADEDCYFSEITGNHHELYADFGDYPYEIKDSGIKILHYSDVRTRARRVDRMYKCLLNQGKKEYIAASVAETHPRVTLKDGHGFRFVPAEYPAKFFSGNVGAIA